MYTIITILLLLGHSNIILHVKIIPLGGGYFQKSVFMISCNFVFTGILTAGGISWLTISQYNHRYVGCMVYIINFSRIVA